MKPLTKEMRVCVDEIMAHERHKHNEYCIFTYTEDEVKSAVELAKKMQSNCRKVIMMIIKRLNPDLLKALNNVLDEYDITIDQCFPVFQEQLEKEGKKWNVK